MKDEVWSTVKIAPIQRKGLPNQEHTRRLRRGHATQLARPPTNWRRNERNNNQSHRPRHANSQVEHLMTTKTVTIVAKMAKAGQSRTSNLEIGQSRSRPAPPHNTQHTTHTNTTHTNTTHTTQIGHERSGQKWIGQKCHWPIMAKLLKTNFGQNWIGQNRS